MKKIVIVSIAILLVCIACLIIILAYIGLVPGLSDIFMKQKDLGIKSDIKLVENFYTKVGVENNFYQNEQPVEGELVYTGTINLREEALSSEEVTSILSSWQKWSPVFIENPQVKIADDGSVELSTIINVSKAKEFAKTLGYSDQEIDKGSKYVKIVNDKIPVYAKGNASMTDNQASFDISNAKIGNFPVPSFMLDEISPVLENALERRISQIPGTDIQKVELKEGKMIISGDIPQKTEIK